jgi:hypothetical protein
LGPLGIAAINRPIVPAPGDYDDGEIGGMIDRGNRSTRENLPQCRFVRHKSHMLPGRESRSPQWEASTAACRCYLCNPLFEGVILMTNMTECKRKHLRPSNIKSRHEPATKQGKSDKPAFFVVVLFLVDTV